MQFLKPFLLGICAISNQPMAGSIIVRHHNLSGFLPFWGIVYGSMRSTHSMSQGFVSACLGGSFPYLWLFVLALWNVGHLLHMLWTVVRRPFQSKCWRRVCSMQVSPVWQSISWYQSTVFFCSAVGKHIFLFRNIKQWFDRPHERCRVYSFYVRLAFVVV